MIATTVRSVIYSALIAAGILAVIVSLTINLQVDKIIAGTNLKVLLGVPIEQYRNEILALVSGGRLLIVPLWMQMTAGFIGCFLAWLGVQGIMLERQGFGIIELLKPKFWISPQLSLSYNPDK